MTYDVPLFACRNSCVSRSTVASNHGMSSRAWAMNCALDRSESYESRVGSTAVLATWPSVPPTLVRTAHSGPSYQSSYASHGPFVAACSRARISSSRLMVSVLSDDPQHVVEDVVVGAATAAVVASSGHGEIDQGPHFGFDPSDQGVAISAHSRSVLQNERA